MTRKAKRITAWVIGLLFVLIMVATLVIGNYFINYALVPNQGAQQREPVVEVLPEGVESQEETLESMIQTNRSREDQVAEEWYAEMSSTKEKVLLTSQDGLELVGHTFLQEEETNHWAVLSHGYQATEESMHTTARRYYEEGYNVLTYDQRAMDESEGQYITMGIKERGDLISWLEVLLENHPQAEIVTHGVSMGAATVLMASGQADFPDAVKAVIADCSYSSVWGVFESELYQRFQLPDFPFLHMAGIVGIPRVGINLFGTEAMWFITQVSQLHRHYLSMGLRMILYLIQWYMSYMMPIQEKCKNCIRLKEQGTQKLNIWSQMLITRPSLIL